MIDYGQARKNMVDNQIRTIGVTDRRLLAALLAVPREMFVPEDRRPLAYIDAAIPLRAGRKIGSPAVFAKLVQLASISSGDRVLDAGAASGYSTAIIARLADSVVGVESDPELAQIAEANLAELGVENATIIEGPVESAGKSKGPYDVIVVGGVLYEDPDALIAQLRPEGRLVALIAREGRPAVAHLFVRTGKGVSARAEFDGVLPEIAPRHDDAFVF